MPRLFAGVCLCLTLSATGADAAFISPRIQYDGVGWETRYFVSSGDPFSDSAENGRLVPGATICVRTYGRLYT